MKTRRKHSLIVILMTVAVLFVAATSISMAATEVKKIVYQGSGKATVYFEESVKYTDDVKVVVKDSDDKTYKTKINSKDENKLQFKISSYKTGRTYKVTVKGIKGGSAVCTLKIYSKSKGVQTAKNKSKATGITDVESKGDTYKGYGIWRVTFTGEISDVKYKFTYLIKQQTNKVMYSKREQV